MKFGLILLAAGESKRFGKSKLEQNLCGKQVLEYVLDATPMDRFEEIILVAANTRIKQTAQKYGIKSIINTQPELKIAHSINLGTQKVKDTDAYLYCVCDQPLLKKDTICNMISKYKSGTILALAHHGRRGNPVIFPSSLYHELVSLKIGESGQKVINNHLDILMHHNTFDKYELMDIDTQENFYRMKKIICQKCE